MFTDLGSTQQQAAAVVAFVLPLALAVPIQRHWTPLAKGLFSFAAYALAGAVIAAVAGEFTGKALWETILEVLTIGVVSYQGLWNPTGAVDAIEKRTQLAPVAAPASTDSPGAAAQAPPTTPEPQAQEDRAALVDDLLRSIVRVLNQSAERTSADEATLSRDANLPSIRRRVDPDRDRAAS